MNDGEKVTAHFVDSISFEQLDSFLNLEEQVLSELAYEVGERYFAIQRTEEGYDYSFYDEDFRLMDGGVYEMMKFLLKKRQRNFWKTKAGLENASVGIMIS